MQNINTFIKADCDYDAIVLARMSERSEEKYPLLLLFTDDGGKNRHQRFAFERNRANGITSGATTIMTQWPGTFSLS